MGVIPPEGMNGDLGYQDLQEGVIHQATPRGMTQQNIPSTNAMAEPIKRDDLVVSPSPMEQILAKRLADVEAVMRRIPEC